MISLLQALGINALMIVLLMCLAYFFREGIKNFFAEKLWEKQQEYNEKKDKRQQEFQRELVDKTAEMQEKIYTALEKQRKEYSDERDRRQQEFQRELSKQNADLENKILQTIEKYKNDLQKTIIDYGKLREMQVKIYLKQNKLLVQYYSYLTGFVSFYSRACSRDFYFEWNDSDVKMQVSKLDVSNKDKDDLYTLWKSDKEMFKDKYLENVVFDLFKKLTAATNKARDYYDLNSLYFTDEITECIEKLLGSFSDIVYIYGKGINKYYLDNLNDIENTYGKNLKSLSDIMKKELNIKFKN